VGSGNSIKGITVAGIGAGANEVTGFTVAGIGAGGNDIQGVTFALGFIRVEDYHGEISGVLASTFNHVKGTQRGVSFGLLNMARRLHGVQFGLINYVADNPTLFKIMPLVNFSFKD
ncbi:MAG: hypothetical protein AAFP70_19535, partial [Calditrichota bacterium]